MNYGPAAYRDHSGKRVAATPIRTALYRYDSYGALICMQGHLSRVIRALEKEDVQVVLLDRTTPVEQRERPNCYEQDWDAVYSQFEFRPKQEECLLQMAANDLGIIDAVPAFGKMWMLAMYCVLHPNAKIDIITKRKSVADSIYRLLLHYISDIGRIGGGHRREERVTVLMADSLHHSKFNADIVLVDEVHELTSDGKMDLLAEYKLAKMYGLTASKETRLDNAWHRLECIFGPTIFKLTQEEAEALDLVVPVCVLWIRVEMPDDPVAGMEDPISIKRFGIWRNDTRNKLIAELAQEMWEEGKQVLLLVDTLDHAVHLKQYLPDFVMCYDESSMTENRFDSYVLKGLLPKNEPIMSARRLEELRLQFERGEIRGAIATGVWSTGVSFNSLEVLGRLGGDTSKTASVQLPGRVCRTDEKTGKEYGIVIDCYDAFNPGLCGRSNLRRREYAARGWEQLEADGRPWQGNR